MDRPNVVIKQVHITTSDLKGRRAVAEDPLEGEDVPAVRQRLRSAARRSRRSRREIGWQAWP
jgi:hypothetical protein